MKKLILITIVGILLGLVALSWSATINVPGTYSTISAAVANAVSGDTILVSSGTYPNEAIDIYNKSLVIRGTGATRPIVTLLGITDGTADLLTATGVGIHSNGTVANPMNVSIENLIFIPSLLDESATRVNNAIGSNSQAALATDFVMNINFDNIVVCPNDGTNNPVSTDGLSFVPLVAPALPFRRAGIEIMGNANVTLTRVVSTNNRPADFAGPGNRQDGLRLLLDFPEFSCTINEGCVFSYNDRMGVCFNNDGNNYTINGSDTARVLFIANGYANRNNADLVLFGGVGGTNPGYLHVNNCNVFSRNLSCLLTDFNDAAGMELSISSCLFSSATAAEYARHAIFLLDAPPTPAQIEHVTIFMNDPAASGIYTSEYTGGASPKNLELRDVIIAGQGAIGITNDEPGTINVSYSNLDTVGIYALSTVAAGTNVAGIVFGSGVIYGDPSFQDTTNFNVTNFAFSAAGPGGAPLAGGANYVGALPLTLVPSGTVGVTVGGTKDFTASGGTNNFTWTLSNDSVGYLSSTTGATVTFTAASAGTVDLTVSDPGLPAQQITVSITAIPTTAPLFKEVEPRKYIRFELFN